MREMKSNEIRQNDDEGMWRVVFPLERRDVCCVPTGLRAAISPASTVKMFLHHSTTNSSVSQSANTDRRNNLNSMLAFY